MTPGCAGKQLGRENVVRVEMSFLQRHSGIPDR